MTTVLALGVLLVVAGQAGFLAGTQPPNLGVREGRLAAQALTPNSVSSQALLHPDNPQSAAAYIAPITFQGDPQVAMDRLVEVLRLTEGARIVTQHPDYIYVQASTKVLNFTDDLEFWIDRPNSVIHMRSASRIGHSDLGKNRARLEDIRARFSR
jgi:uncharacterized protein (DUF1499 family)